jgi:uncharacterized protein YndB with AHSA1/START domain
MASILLRVPIDADRDSIFDALATSAGVRGWWNNHTEGPSGLDSTMSVSFPDAPMPFEFRVTDQSPGRRVAWRCVAGPPEWIGTDLSFEIQQGDDGSTSVLFTHGGWETTEESFPFIAYSWAQILPRLKNLAESGQAKPFFDF